MGAFLSAQQTKGSRRGPIPGVAKSADSRTSMENYFAQIFNYNTRYRVGPTVGCHSLQMSVLVRNPAFQISTYINF